MYGVLPTLSGAGLRRCTEYWIEPATEPIVARNSVTLALQLASNVIRGYKRQSLARTPNMRKWTMPLTLLGLGGLGYLILSERGQQALRWVAEYVSRGPEKFLEWNESAQRELDRIQEALNRVADSLQGDTIESM